ncbi:hypothetical protein KBA63_00555 [Candidatus Woesebacteria bacterium]|jgi:hypothetical protein|nr:hypothetical protein [Candidatus Woesebacteria bacterium]MBP9687407.1 hypothetical protein [Candidatus Woesebacteria bacterium]
MSAETLIEVIVERLSGEIIRIVRPQQVTRKQIREEWMNTDGPVAGISLSYLCIFNRTVGQRPFAIKMIHDTIFAHDHKHGHVGHCDYCNDSSHADHWFAMSPGARRVYLATNNLDGRNFLPDVIGSGAGIWEIYSKFIGKGLLHNQYRIPTNHGWQNRLLRLDQNRDFLIRVIAFFNRDELSNLTDCPYVALVSWDQGGTKELKVTIYARSEHEKELLNWIKRFKTHSTRTTIVRPNYIDFATC